MFNRSLKWLAGAALATAAIAAVPSFTEAHAHYTGTTPPSLLAMGLSPTPTHARTASHASQTLARSSHRTTQLVSKKAKKHKKHKKHKKAAYKHKAA